uniref:Regulator of MON1-CCZ1 n=1 Tax=Eptatretus burgeri TaxID=7764 RepID=A0A8C4PY00_EPTBU
MLNKMPSPSTWVTVSVSSVSCDCLPVSAGSSMAGSEILEQESSYLELCRTPVRFEEISSVNNVFFDEANKQVFAVRAGGAVGVVVRGLDEKQPISFRLEDKGEIKSIKLSPGNRIVAVQRSGKSVDFCNLMGEATEYSQECRGRNCYVLGFCWTSPNEIVFITDQGLELYQVQAEKRSVKLIKSMGTSFVNWFVFSSEGPTLLLSLTPLGNVLQPVLAKVGNLVKLTKFEVEVPVIPKPPRLCLTEPDVTTAVIYGQLYVVVLRHRVRTTPSQAGSEVWLYHLSRDGHTCKIHVLQLNSTGCFATNVVDNLVVIHHRASKTSMVFDIQLKKVSEGPVKLHQPVLPSLPICPFTIQPRAGASLGAGTAVTTCELYSTSWIVFRPDIIMDAGLGYLWSLRLRLPRIVATLPDRLQLVDFLLLRRDCRPVLLNVCSQLLSGGQAGGLAVVSLVFDKLNSVYKEWLEADKSDAAALDGGAGGRPPTPHKPVRSHAVVDQWEMYTSVLVPFAESKTISYKFVIAVLMEYIRSLTQFHIHAQHYLYELVINTLVRNNAFYQLHQLLQYHVLSDSKKLACLMLSLESFYPPAHQLALDMLKMLSPLPQRLSTANDEIVEVLLSKGRVLAALRFVRASGGADIMSARKFLEAASHVGDSLLFFCVFKFFEQRNQRLRNSPHFNPVYV